MIKYSIRFVSFIFSIFALLLFFQYVSISQQNMPFGTTMQLRLNVSQSNTNKEKLIDDLNEIADRDDSIIVKVVTNTDNYENEKDIIWFGSIEPKSDRLVVNGENIEWFDSSLRGHIFSSVEMGTRPLNGIYAIKGGHILKKELQTWAEDNGIEITWLINPSPFRYMYIYLIQNGIGNAVIAALLLLLITLISWFVTHAKSRAIRLLGGIKSIRIHAEDTMTLVILIASGFFVGWLVMLGYIAITGSIQQVLLIVFQSFIYLAVILILISIFVMGISIMVRAKAKHIALRKIPLKRFNQLSIVIRIVTIILALLIVPTTMTSAYILRQLSNEYALWKNMQDHVRLSFRDIDSLETKEMLPKVEEFFYEMEEERNIQLSLVIDKSIELSEEELGNYDHIIITDKAWIDYFDVGIERQGDGGKLTAIEFDKLSSALKTYLVEQLPLWTKSGQAYQDGIKFYEYSGEEFLALPPNVGWGSETVQAKKPLIILVDNPAVSLKAKGFLLYAASSGNVVFPNEEKLRLGLSKFSLDPYIVSIDSIADVALEQAQKFSKDAVYYVMACIFILITIILAGVMSARLWSGSNKKRIFTLHTFGYSYGTILKPMVKNEIYISIIAIIIGLILSYFIRHPHPVILIIVAIIIGILYGIGCLFAYIAYAQKAFYQTCHRYY